MAQSALAKHTQVTSKINRSTQWPQWLPFNDFSLIHCSLKQSIFELGHCNNYTILLMLHFVPSLGQKGHLPLYHFLPGCFYIAQSFFSNVLFRKCWFDFPCNCPEWKKSYQGHHLLLCVFVFFPHMKFQTDRNTWLDIKITGKTILVVGNAV